MCIRDRCGASLVTEEVADTQDEDQTSDFKLCPSCNQKNEINAKFCVICGHKFQESVNVDEAPAEPTEKVAAEPVEELSLIHILKKYLLNARHWRKLLVRPMVNI